MPFQIRPITETEFAAWRTLSRENYASEKEREGYTADDARAEAEASFQRHLPRGLGTPDHYVYSVTLDDRTIGTLWWGVQKQGAQRIAWIFDIGLEPSQRGRGLGKRTMEWALADAKAKGFAKLGLHVFAHNDAARKLYESLAFRTTNIIMYRDL